MKKAHVIRGLVLAVSLFVFFASIYSYCLILATPLWRRYAALPGLAVIKRFIGQLALPFYTRFQQPAPKFDFDAIFFPEGFIFIWPLLLLLFIIFVFHPAVARLCRMLFRRLFLLETSLAVILGTLLSVALARAGLHGVRLYAAALVVWSSAAAVAVAAVLWRKRRRLENVLLLGFFTACRYLVYQVIFGCSFYLLVLWLGYLMVVPAHVFAEHVQDAAIKAGINPQSIFARLTLLSLTYGANGYVLLLMIAGLVLTLLLIPRLALEATLCGQAFPPAADTMDERARKRA